MSGHSKWATIHRQKEVKDAARGQLFSKLARAISIAAKTGGGINPDSNFKLKVAIDKAKAENLPKDNIERVLQQAQDRMDSIEEVTYEGFGPFGVGVIVEAATDNRNRTSQEIKNVFERVGGRLGGPGSVSYNFDQKGMLVISKSEDMEKQILELIDSEVEDYEETEYGIEAYMSPSKLRETKKALEDKGMKITSVELIQKPKSYVFIENSGEVQKVINFLETLNEHEDVQKVFTNVDF